MADRYFIFRMNGTDFGITDDPNKAAALYEKAIELGFIEDHTELNNLTTTYYFTTHKEA